MTIIAQRSEFGQLSRSFQSNQPTSNPIRERSVDNVPSQEIDGNSFCEEPSSSERMERLVETNVNSTRSSEDKKDFNVEQTRERTVRPVNTHHVTVHSVTSQNNEAFVPTILFIVRSNVLNEAKWTILLFGLPEQHRFAHLFGQTHVLQEHQT